MVVEACARSQTELPAEWPCPLAWEPQRTALISLANVWLAEGAAAVIISIEGSPIVALSADGRPPQAVPQQPQLTAPILWNGRPAGEIRVVGAVTPNAQARVAAEAQLVGLLLESEADLASMTDELIQTQDQLLAVYDLGQLARQPLRLAERLLALASAAGRLLNVDGAAVVLASDGREPVVAQDPPAAHAESWLLTLLRYLPDAASAGAAGAAAAASAAGDDSDLGGADGLWQGRRNGAAGEGPSLPERVKSLLLAPVGDGERVQGAFVFWSEQPERFASPDIKLARAIAEHAGVQIENALLQRDRIVQARFETEMQLARRVQTNLLPKALPRLPGLDLYASTRPASHVGGDFFDFVADSADSTVFLVSDVSGKGMSAALVMTMTRTMLRTILRSVVGRTPVHAGGGVGAVGAAAAASALPRPAALLGLVNDELFGDLTELSMFATAFVAQYHHATRRLVYANAGHSPVIYLPAGGRPQLLEAGSPPIGVVPALGFAERVLTLRPGDLLVAASDGFNETRNAADEMFGLERLMRCVAERAHLPAQGVGQALFAAVEAFRDGEMQEDDQTLVIAKGA